MTAARLAEETGVSLRSLYRDIDSLRAAGAHIEGERGFGYRLIEDQALPPQTFDRMEIEALSLGMAEVSRMGDTALAKAAASVLAKVAATLPTKGQQQLFHAIYDVYRPKARFSTCANLDVLREACWKETAVAISYADKGNSITQRTILPLAVIYAETSLIVLAWCRLREAFRMFHTDKILEIATTGETFRPHRAAMLRDYRQQLQGRTVMQS